MRCPYSKRIVNPTFLKCHPEYADPYAKNEKGDWTPRAIAPVWKLSDLLYKASPDGTKWNVEPFLEVPCGKCNICMSNRKQEWIFRLRQELSNSRHGACFVTLTYDDLHLPFRDSACKFHRLADEVLINEEAHQSLCKRDFQLFMKRLRKKSAPLFSPVRFYAVGEYGGKLKRPHYHVVLFNIPHWPLPGYDPYIFIGECWHQGLIDLHEVNGRLLNYVVSYMDLKQYKPHEFAEPQFCLMSRRPGIGSSFIVSDSPDDPKISERKRFYNVETLLSKNAVVSNDGLRMPLPRYYRDKLYDESDRLDNQVMNYANKHELSLQEEEIFNEKRQLALQKDKILAERAIKKKKHIC